MTALTEAGAKNAAGGLPEQALRKLEALVAEQGAKAAAQGGRDDETRG